MSITDNKLSLKEQGNEEYYKITHDCNLLIIHYNKINGELNHLTKSLKHPIKIKNRLIKIKKDIKIFYEEYLKWNSEIDYFILNPKIIVGSPNNLNLTFLHFMNYLYFLKNKIYNYDSILYENYKSLIWKRDSIINFRIAIASFIIAIIGLFISIYPLIFC